MTGASPSLAARTHVDRSAAAALDIEGVAALGFDRWRADYAWPVSDAEFDRLAEAVWDAFFDGLAALSGREQDLFKADIRLPGFLIQHLHLKAAAARLNHASSGVPHGRQIAAHLTPDWSVLGAAFAAAPRAPSRLGHAARSLGKNWILNAPTSLPSRLAACLGRADAWALGSRSPLRAAYQAQEGAACRFVTLDDLPAAVATPLGDSLARAVRGSLERIDAAAQKLLAVALDTEGATAAWLRRLGDLAALMAAVDRVDRYPRRLLLTNLGQPTYRAVALALRRHGVKVVGFHHGNDMGAQPSLGGDIVDLLAVDRFVVPSEACVRWRREAYSGGPLAALQPVSFERVKLPLYDEWLAIGRRAALPQKIDTVMIVGFPPNWLRYPHLAAHWALTQLDVEVTLIEALGRAGFKVLYKAHPEFERETRQLFRNLACTFVGGHLESRWQLADAFVFPRISSTSFGFALCTNRPVVVLDTAIQDWRKDAYALLARRCRMVPARVEEGVRLCFDENALIAALRAPVREPDRAFIDQAMRA